MVLFQKFKKGGKAMATASINVRIRKELYDRIGSTVKDLTGIEPSIAKFINDAIEEKIQNFSVTMNHKTKQSPVIAKNR
ncbi:MULTISPECIES: hypothetical protein [Leptospira]|uniref:hypothetical protein n=1 Tax=Leptospira TaxID=171 RepID=UPI000347AFCD|nr:MULTISPECIES: hypothetical protein [Leptospira]ULG86603.1 hypothetical protein FH594_21250 [Leptospira interrogans]ULG86619.1 hypothetical protein FH594_20805 [Leptospira interrogans]UML77767.1 hypothetical protein FH583_09705 [Leptospira interrogans]UML78794.1 hypothetical protein FH602_01935 [Leptospira kirschneri]UMQ56452.1 hypothetical protein FH582_21785 [Leptospira interrogans]